MNRPATSTLAHEAGHAVALYHYFGPIMAEVELTPEPQVRFFSPLAKSTEWRDALGMAVVAVAGVTAATIVTGNDYPLRVVSNDAGHLEDAYQHLQDHWTRSRIELPTPKAFIRTAYSEAAVLIEGNYGELERVMKHLVTAGSLPDEYLEPEHKHLKSEIQRLRRELEHQRGQATTTQATSVEHDTKALRTAYEVKDLITGFVRPDPVAALQRGYELSMRLNGSYLHRSGALQGGGGQCEARESSASYT